MSVIALKNVEKIYKGGVLAVEDFNLEIGECEFIILVGPSGCGKSTVLRMIAGLEDISSGELIIDGELVNDVEPKDRDVAMVFQNYALYPHMTIYDNIAFSLKMKKMNKKEIEKRVLNVAEKLEITPFLKRKPSALSGGQRQRVALGRAMVRNPRVFLLDEPLSNLDAKLRVAMRREIVSLYRELKTTFVYVTHDQTEAMTMGTRIVVMDKGVIHQIDTPQNVYDFPCNQFVAGFIGSPQMNFFDVEIKSTTDGSYAYFEKNSILLAEHTAQKIQSNRAIMGIRPEDFIITHKSQKPDFEVKVDFIESTGFDRFIFFHIGNSEKSYAARIYADTSIFSGDIVPLCANINKLHFFDSESKKNLLLSESNLYLN